MDDEDSESTLLRKRNRENKKINAARQRTHARFEALLTVGSGSEDVSESTPRNSARKAGRTQTSDGTRNSVRKAGRTQTSDGTTIKANRSPEMKRRSRSQENLLRPEESDLSTSHVPKTKKARQRKIKGSEQPNGETSNTRSKNTPPKGETQKEGGTENQGFERNSFNDGIDVAADDSIAQAADDEQSQIRNEENEGKKKHRKKRRQQPKVNAAERIMQALDKKRHDDGLLLCVVIHKADQLKPDARVHHPVIRVHVVHLETGQYIKKTDISRNVTSLHERKNENENLDYVLPVMTQPFDFKRNRSFTPQWEEALIYNEMYSYFLQREQNDPPVIIFFELLDFMQMSLNRKDFIKTDKGWHRIAWAFLKLVSPSGATNTDKKCRLQFYQPITRMKVQKDDNAAVEIFQWWMYGTRQKYSSTLYVTIKGVTTPHFLKRTTRSMFPTQEERGELTFEELNKSSEAIASSDHDASLPIWTKLPGQVNHIPNKFEMALPSGRKGCSAVQFSYDGRYLACACATGDSYPVRIYEFPEGKLICSFGNHFGIVYDLCWLANGKELLSVSADTTVRCWDTKRFSLTAIKLFPHPAYVYTAKYHPKQPSIVVTGSYDCTIRIWNKISDGIHALLLRELADHKGYVNTMVFSGNGSRLFSGDSTGVMIEWNAPAEKKKRSDLGELVNRWQRKVIVELDEIKNVAIGTLLLHPGEMKILIHTKDSMLRMFDLRSYAVLKSYVGGMNYKEHIHASFSFCGSFIFCGTENGFVNVWNTETGDHVYTYKDLGSLKAISDIHFHPHDNYIAFCCYGDGYPISIYLYDPKVALDLTKPFSKPATTNSLETRKSLEETTKLYQSMRTASNIMHDTNTLKEAKSMLDSVTMRTGDLNETKNRVTFRDLSPSSNQSNSPIRFQDTNQTMMSTWGSDFTYTQAVSPQVLSTSPHAQQHLGASGRFYGRQASISSPLPPMKINQTAQDRSLVNSSPKPIFTFDGKRPDAKDRKVVSLYEYTPNRNDELALQPNDLITVLYEDNAHWWMGRLEDGRQGYFPANYVMEADSNYGNQLSFTDDISGSHSAVVDKHGNLRILSAPDDSGGVIAGRSSRKKRHERKK